MYINDHMISRPKRTQSRGNLGLPEISKLFPLSSGSCNMEDHNLYQFSPFCKKELFCNESTFMLTEDTESRHRMLWVGRDL